MVGEVSLAVFNPCHKNQSFDIWHILLCLVDWLGDLRSERFTYPLALHKQNKQTKQQQQQQLIHGSLTQFTAQNFWNAEEAGYSWKQTVWWYHLRLGSFRSRLEMSIPVQVLCTKSAPREASGSGAGWTGKRKSQTESNFRQYPSLSPTLKSLEHKLELRPRGQRRQAFIFVYSLRVAEGHPG